MNRKFMTAGYLYCLTNDSMPYYKVGRTIDLPLRIKQLQTTGVPTPFYLEKAEYCQPVDYAEKLAHHFLDEFLVAENREFFDCDREDVDHAFYCVCRVFNREIECPITEPDSDVSEIISSPAESPDPSTRKGLLARKSTEPPRSVD